MPLPRTPDRKGRFDRKRDPEQAGDALGSKRARSKEASHTPILLLIIVLASLATMLWYRVFLSKYNQGLVNAVAEKLHLLFPDSVVQIGRVSADGPNKIVINNLKLASKTFGGQRPVVTIHRAVLHGDLDIADWLQKTTRVSQVQLYGVRIDAWPNAAGVWSVQTLKPQAGLDATPPTITFEDATLRLYADASPQENNVIGLHDIQGQIKPWASGPQMVPGAASSATDRPPLEFNLTCRSTGLLKHLELSGQLDLARESWFANGSMQNLNFSPRLLESLPSQLSQSLSQLSGLECSASSDFFISQANSEEVRFDVQGRLAAGRLKDPRLPYPLEGLSAKFFCANGLLQVRDMQATNSSGAQLVLGADILGFGRDVPIEIRATAQHLEIDSRLRESLPASLQGQWDRLQPSGHVSGSVKLAYDGTRWTPELAIDCEHVAIKPWLFPYPLTQIQGRIQLQDGTLSSEELTGLAGGQPVTSSFRLSRSGSQWFGKLDAHTDSPVAIDEQLISALTPIDHETTSVETFVRSLHPRGTVQLTRATFERESDNEPAWHRTLDINVYGGSIKYDHFRYPIHEIQGRIAGQDDSWWLHRFEGRNDSGKILCSGNWRSGTHAQLPFDLRFEATAVPIEEELLRALTPDAQAIWEEIQPSGSVDRVDVQLSRRPHEGVTTSVKLVEDSQSNQATGRSLRIQPKNFPVWLTDIDCDIAYQPGQVTIHQASGVNGDSRLSIRGECRPQADGRWLANVVWQPRTRLIVDSQLLRALPRSMRNSLDKLDFRGPVSILGRSQILFGNQATARINTAWECQLDVENGQLGNGKSIGGMRGTVVTSGSSDGSDLQAIGSVAMDAVSVFGVPLTRLRGPFKIEDNSLYFGSQAGLEMVDDRSTDMTADALTGRLVVSGMGRLDTGKFIIDAHLQQAGLSGLLRDVGVERASTKALCDANLNFSGIPWNSQTWDGEGDIHLTDAKLFQLPIMMRLLRTASVSADDDSAFQTADIHFDIDGDRIPLTINCVGDLLRLQGEGWTNLRREIDLELYSYVGRRPIYSVVSPLLPESKYATFMMIEVEGTLDNPIMQRRPFPQIEATLQQIFPEVAGQSGIGSLAPWQ